MARIVLLAEIAANVAYGLRSGTTGALLSVWPVAAYVGCMELLTWMRASTGIRLDAEPAPATAPADAIDELASRRDHKPEPDDLLSAAELAFPRPDADNVPSLRQIQRALRVGQPKAQQVQAHFTGRDADAV